MKTDYNSSFLLTLVSDTIKTVAVTFNPDEPNVKQYTYMTILEGLEVGQDVIAEAGSDLSLVTITEIHDEPQVDPHAAYNYKWVVSTKGRDARKNQAQLHAMEESALKQIAKAKRNSERKRLKEELSESFDLDALKSIKLGGE